VSFPLTPARIAQLLPPPAKMRAEIYAANIALHWPLIDTCLSALGITSNAALIAALATIRVECPPFHPVKEYGGDAYLNRMYDTRKDLGNTPEADGDGALYGGRGFAQLTGKDNYRRAGVAIGVDLVARPDEALEPNGNAAIFAWFFHEHNIARVAEAGDWVRVRKIWNGGRNGLDEFLGYVKTLEGACNA
jgi:putative chitinase